MTILKDGRTSNTLIIDSNNHLHADVISVNEESHAARFGDKFNINTGDITLTSAAKTSVLYVKNTGDDDLAITGLIYTLGNTTGGSGDIKIDVVRNPTAGDIITNANNVLVGTGVEANLNFGSTKSLSVLAYKGATGETALSGGSVCLSTRLVSSGGRSVLSVGQIRLPKGASIGIDYTPPTSNTSQIVQFAVATYVVTPLVHSEV